MKLRNKITALIMALSMSLCMVPTVAFASDGQSSSEEREVGTATDGDGITVTVDGQEIDLSDLELDGKGGDMLASIFGLMMSGLEETEESDPLTPKGNLSLVDDIGSVSGKGKQFITVVTKTGNYFYIIIDRDAEGEGTVHFLNQVDEADLFHLLDEKAQEEYIQQITETEEPEVVEPDPEPEPEPEVEPEPEKKSSNLKGILGILAILGIVGAGGGYYVVQNMKKKKDDSRRPDPDEDYDADDDASDDTEYVDLDDVEDSYNDDEDDPVYDSDEDEEL